MAPRQVLPRERANVARWAAEGVIDRAGGYRRRDDALRLVLTVAASAMLRPAMAGPGMVTPVPPGIADPMPPGIAASMVPPGVVALVVRPGTSILL